SNDGFGNKLRKNMRVYERVAEVLWHFGVRQIFGVAGSGNYRVTRELMELGAKYVGARHEGGAVSMADAFSRMGDSLPMVSVHQGGGLTNLVTGLTEAVKSHTPLLVMAGEAPLADRRSNFRIDQPGLVEAVGAVSVRISQNTPANDVREAIRIATRLKIPVVINFPTDVQVMETSDTGAIPTLQPPPLVQPDAESVRQIAELLLDAQAPLIVGGRGARGYGQELRVLAERTGALTATSAVARGLFHDDPFSLDVMGDLAAPITMELVLRSDLIVAFGCSLGQWTTSNGSLIPQDAKLVQIDTNPLALGFQRPVDIGVVGDAAITAQAIMEHIPEMEELATKRRTPATRKRISEQLRWQLIEYRDTSTADRIDPRTATIALDEILDDDRNIAIDSGNFLGYPSMFLTVKDERSLCFSQAFQCVGLGLAAAIGYAFAQPDRLTICGTGDGGLLMASTELETIARLKLPMVIIVYNDSAYGAEVHHFGRTPEDLGFVSFPDVDFAAIARGHGLTGVTVRNVDDFAGVREWISGPRDAALMIDMKVTDREPSWWLADAFKAESH
ncbi:MAG: thiamine pyrophosphate-binding protein, partial [Nakamurella sp.]